MSFYILTIDQGTSSTRALVFSREYRLLAKAQLPLPSAYPHEGWVEQAPEIIWKDALSVANEALRSAGVHASQVAGLSISNQRETTIIWDRKTGEPIYPAIVWQDRRTLDQCSAWADQGLNDMVQSKTGLLLDPYFSASKIRWILDNVPDARDRANRGELAFGTIDTFLVWKLTSGKSHVTDMTNASRTMLYNIHTFEWDQQLLEAFDIPMSILPEVKPNVADFGEVDAAHLGAAMPIVAMAGDQQAATVGQACFLPGMMKATFGTGCFMLLNTGKTPLVSKNRLLTTLAYHVGDEMAYALEGSVFVAGAAVQWLRDAMKLIRSSQESEQWAVHTQDTQGVYFVPAFSGLGAPYWDAQARGAILGLTHDSGIGHIVRAALESVCYSVKDLWLAMEADGAQLATLRVDGGMTQNDWLMQFLSNMLDAPVERAAQMETTALGVAFLAGLKLGWFHSLADIARLWELGERFDTRMESAEREKLYAGWVAAVSKIRTKS
ncbi:MAG: glycerol kinase GlpK [Gammaproteobacteria bacterium]